tara:strand:- start:22026 stop:23096 length:1071 start_codon:yes stop_codon:yes gene_type:complete
LVLLTVPNNCQYSPFLFQSDDLVQSNKRFLNFSIEHLRSSRQGFWFALDLVMLLLLSLNLFLIIVDSVYRIGTSDELIATYFPALSPALEYLRENFLFIDLCFVAIFLSEFCLRWAVSVRNSDYARWFYYPVIHWYDLVGCIPLGGARLLRFLRVFSIIHRLQKYRIIDVRQTAIYRFCLFYYEALLEELSDRVVIKVINGIQEDIRSDETLTRRAVEELVKPRLDKLLISAKAVTSSIAGAMKSDVDHPFSEKLRSSVIAAMQNNAELKRLSTIPMIGEQLSDTLEDAVAEVVIDSIACLIDEFPELLKEDSLRASLRTSDASWEALDAILLNLIDDVLEFAKQQVATQKWKQQL